MLQFIKILICFTGIATVVSFAFYGWGTLFQRIAKYPVKNWVLTIAIGLAAIIFLGGVLNLLRLAYGWALDGLLAVGFILAVIYTKFKLNLPHNKARWFYVFILSLVITIIIVFTVKTQLPPKAFNMHDDFEKYFAHPARMLQTGTLFGSPLSAIGTETLGGQAVLHGIVLNHFPIQYINGVDAIFGLLLCLILTVSVFPLRLIYLPMSLISILVVFFIYPQYVNISILYIGSALIMALILLYYQKSSDADSLPSSILIGLIYAALMAAKPIFAVFCFIQLCVFIIIRVLFRGGFLRTIHWGVFTGFMALLFLSPWILLHMPHYVKASVVQVPGVIGTVSQKPLNFLSMKPLFYGCSFAHYTFVAVLPAVTVLGMILCKFRKPLKYLSGLTASGIAILATYFLLILLGPSISGYEHSLRYTIPFLIAGAPIVLSLVYLKAFEDKSYHFRLSFSTITVLFGIVIIIIFAGSLINRAKYAYKTGSMLAFLPKISSQDYIRYSEDVLYGDIKLKIKSAQQHVPVGKAVVAWVYAPFYLDYKRNIIFDTEPAGIANPWAHIFNANYFLIEYNGPAVRSPDIYYQYAAYPYRRERYNNQMCIVFLKILQEIQEDSEKLYDDGRIVVFKRKE